MAMKKAQKRITCIEDRCFANEYDAGKYLLKLASEHKRVKISHVDVGD